MPENTAAARAPVLVVDDEEIYLRALVADLARRGFAVTACRDVASAEAAWQQLETSASRGALIVDLIQPGEAGGYLGGLELLRRLKVPVGRDVVALADNEASWLRTAALSLGAGRVVTKPDLRRAEPEHLDHLFRRFLAEIAGEAPPMPPAAGGTAGGHEALEPLLGALEELRHAAGRSSVLLLLMRFASTLLDRGVIYEVRDDRLVPSGGFGPGAEDGVALGGALPLDRDTLPGRAFWSARLQRARGSESGSLAPPLGPPTPGEAVALPVMGPDGVVAVLYADTIGCCGGSLGDLRPLTALAGAACLLLERRPEPSG